MSNLKKAAELILRGDFKEALSSLKTERMSEQSVKMISLLFRYFGNYHKEEKLLQMSKINSLYISERQQWHKQSMFDKTVPRQPLHLPKEYTPEQHVLEQLCIIAGSDSNTYEMLIELIESVKATRSYKDVDFYVFDVGMSDDERHYIAKNFPSIKMINPGWQVPSTKYSSPTSQKHNFLASRCYMDKIIPNYRYYLTIDADAWVHDERSIDAYISLCLKQGIAIAKNPCAGCDYFRDCHWYKNDKRIPPEDEVKIKDKTMYNAGVFCVDKETKFFDNWAKYFEKIVESTQMRHGVSESTLVYTMHEYHKEHTKEHLGHWCNFSSEREGPPIIHSSEDNILYVPFTNEPVGVFHMLASIKHINHHYYAPTQKRNSAITKAELRKHLEYFKEPLKKCRNKELPRPMDLFPSAASYSMHYRVWPWADKEEIKNQLIELAKEI